MGNNRINTIDYKNVLAHIMFSAEDNALFAVCTYSKGYYIICGGVSIKEVQELFHKSIDSIKITAGKTIYAYGIKPINESKIIELAEKDIGDMQFDMWRLNEIVKENSFDYGVLKKALLVALNFIVSAIALFIPQTQNMFVSALPWFYYPVNFIGTAIGIALAITFTCIFLM